MSLNVIVTGASGSLGRSVCSVFQEHNWNVHAVTRRPEQEALGVLRECASIRHLDLSGDIEVERAFSHFDAIDAVIHCTGGIRAGVSIAESNVSLLDEMISLNLRTTYNVMRSSAPLLGMRGGTFICVAARAALHAEAHKGAYAAAKAAVIALCATFAEEGRTQGIRAHTVVPGILKTPSNVEWAKNGEERSWIEPKDVAQCMYSLCTEEFSGVSGLVVPMLEGVQQ